MAWEAEVSASTTDTAWVLGPGGQRGRGAQAGPHLPRIGVMWEGNQDRWAPWQDPQSMPVLKAPGCRQLTACSEPTRSRTCSRFQGPLPHHRGSPLPSDFLPSPGPYLFAPRVKPRWGCYLLSHPRHLGKERHGAGHRVPVTMVAARSQDSAQSFHHCRVSIGLTPDVHWIVNSRKAGMVTPFFTAHS